MILLLMLYFNLILLMPTLSLAAVAGNYKNFNEIHQLATVMYFDDDPSSGEMLLNVEGLEAPETSEKVTTTTLRLQIAPTTEAIGDEKVESYQDLFPHGYMPFDDHSEIAPQRYGRLKTIERCNIAFDDYLKRNKVMLRKSLPDLPVKVSIMFIVTNIYEVRERDQTVTLSAFIELSWRDLRLLNATDEECATVSFSVNDLAESIWFPVWTIENSAERTLYYEAWEKFPAVVHNRSVISWISSFRLVLNCPMNMLVFPFDVQNCKIMIRSPHYYVNELQYYVYSIQQGLLLWNENVSHPLWSVTGQEARQSVPWSNQSGIEILFRLERRPNFYIWTVIIPTVLISVATVLAFILPSHSTEKLQTILTGILAYFLLLLNLTEVTPQASENIPILTLFYVIIIAAGILGSVVCALIVRVANAEKANRFLIGSALTPAGQLLSRRLSAKTKSVLNQISGNCRCCGLSSEVMNDLFLIVYVLVLILCYSWLVFYTFTKREQNIRDDERVFNYTPVLTF